MVYLPAHNVFHTRKDFDIKRVNKNLAVLTSKPLKSPFLFDSLVLSVSAKLMSGAAILAQAAVKTDKGWSGFYKLFYISQNYKKTFAPQKDIFAKTDIDTLLPQKPSQYFKYQITVLGKADINLICAALTKANAKYDESLALETLDVRDFEIPLAPINPNKLADKTLSQRVCSPAALAAVLNYYGKKISLAQAVKGVYDEHARIYGAWPLNIAFAAQQGLTAAFIRCSSLAQAEGEILQGRPVIASVAYKKGALKNAAITQTDGHLIVIAGFDKAGNIIAADGGATRKYDRKQFAKAWLKNKKGAAYALTD